MGTGTVYLVRHGETEWNRTGRIQGWAPVGINDRGREQAAAAGAYLADRGVDRLVASDLRRTRETARVIRPLLGLDHDAVTFDGGWRERSFGRLQGLPYEEVYGLRPEFAVGESGVAALEATPAEGESVLTARERVLATWGSLADGLGGGTVAVVTHGGPIHVLRAHLNGRDLVAELTGTHTTNGAIDEVRVEDGDATPVGTGTVPDGAPDPDPDAGAGRGGIR
jgi:probable phosphoglycerate mutase